MYSVIVVLNCSCFYSYLALSFQSVGHRAYCKVQFSEHVYKPCNAGGAEIWRRGLKSGSGGFFTKNSW